MMTACPTARDSTGAAMSPRAGCGQLTFTGFLKSLATLLSCRAELLHFIGNWLSDTNTFGIKAYTERKCEFTPHPPFRGVAKLQCNTYVWMAES